MMQTEKNSGQDYTRVRVCLAVLNDKKQILLVPHFLENDEVCWYLPGGGLEFGEKLTDGAKREFREETGLETEVLELIDTFEIMELEKPWHSITIIFRGKITGGELKTEQHHMYGERKNPQWFTKEELEKVSYRPTIELDKLFRN